MCSILCPRPRSRCARCGAEKASSWVLRAAAAFSAAAARPPQPSA
ncbi:hypothetical protein GWL_04970 [Herbaspirillum sp. GW103]|nr:hypothetical protein GWL_04970 [Herbaspirillum sp. GW103]